MTVPDTAERTHVPIPVTAMHRVEHLALRGMAAALGTLGFTRAGSIGARLGALGYAPLGIRRGVVERQITAAFPELSRDEVKRLARRSYEHLGRTTIEGAILPRYSATEIIDLYDEVHGWEFVEGGLARGKGLIVATGHLGNWELAGAYVAARLSQSGRHLHAIARHMANPLVDEYVTETRERIGMDVVHDEQAVRRVPRALRSGDAVAFLMDQGVVGLASTWVPFFGRLAKTPRGPAVFALRLGTPMVFGVGLRKPNGKYAIHFEPVEAERTEGSLEEDVDRIVTTYTNILERWVRRAPEQYFWHHRRWKHQRPGTPPELGEP